METQALLEKIVQNLTFEVEAVPKNDAELIQASKNVPMTVKIRVRKKEKSKRGQNIDVTVKSPQLARLASNQTVLSFDVSMGSEFGNSALSPARHSFLSFWRTGTCTGAENEDHYPYMPSSSYYSAKLNNANQKGQLKQSITLTKNDGNRQVVKRTPTTFFGKCRPGGCLDPSGNEDIYSYQPTELAFKSKRPSKARSNTPVTSGYIHPKDISNEMPIGYSKSDKDNTDEHTITSNTVDDLHPYKSEPITLDKKYFSHVDNIYEQKNDNGSKRKSSIFDSNFFKKKRKSSLSSASTKSSISHSSEKISKLRGDTSSTILTYPPLIQDDYITTGDEKIRTSESQPVKPFNEFATTYYIRPKKADGVQKSEVSGSKSSPTENTFSVKPDDSSNATVGKAGIPDNNINVLRTKLSGQELSANNDIFKTDDEKVTKDGKNLFLAPLPLPLIKPTEKSNPNVDLDKKTKTATSQSELNEPTTNSPTGKVHSSIPTNRILRNIPEPENSSKEHRILTKPDISKIPKPNQLRETVLNGNKEPDVDTSVDDKGNDYLSTKSDTDNITSENIQSSKIKMNMSSESNKNNTFIPIPILMPIPIPLMKDKNYTQQSNRSSYDNDYSNSKLSHTGDVSQNQINEKISKKPEGPNSFYLKEKEKGLKNLSNDYGNSKLQSPESKQSDNKNINTIRRGSGSSEPDNVNSNITYSEDFHNFASADKDGKPRINDISKTSKLINNGDHIKEVSHLSKDQDNKVERLDNYNAKPSTSSFAQIESNITDQIPRFSDSSRRSSKLTKFDVDAPNFTTSIRKDSKKSNINKTFEQNQLYTTKSNDTLKLSLVNINGDKRSESKVKQISKDDTQNESPNDEHLIDYTNKLSARNRDTITIPIPLLSNQTNDNIVNRVPEQKEHPRITGDNEIKTTDSDKNSTLKFTQDASRAQEPYFFASSDSEIRSTKQYEPAEQPIVQVNQINKRLLPKTEKLISLDSTRKGESTKSMSDIINDFALPAKTIDEYKTDENISDSKHRLNEKARYIDTTSSNFRNGKFTRRAFSQEKILTPINKSFVENVEEQNIEAYNIDADGRAKYGNHITGNIPSQDNIIKTFAEPSEELSEINRHVDPNKSVDAQFSGQDKSKGLRTSEPTILPKSLKEIESDLEQKYIPNITTNLPEVLQYSKNKNEKGMLKPIIKSPNASISRDSNRKILDTTNHTADWPEKRFSGNKKYPQKQESITANLAFQTYINENNLREIKTFDPANDTGILDENSTVIKFQQLKLHENEVIIPIDSKHDMAIHIKTPTMSTDQDIYDTHSETALFSQPKNGKQVKIRVQEGDLKSRTSYPHGSLEYLYEQELIPLQHTIRNLKKEIDALNAQQIAFKEKIFNTKKIEDPIKICKCVKNIIDKYNI